MNKLITVINFIATSFILLSGSLYMTNQWRHLQPYILLGGMLSIVICTILSGNKIRFNIWLFIIYWLFFISCIISAIINQDVELLEGGLILYAIYIMGVLYPCTFENNISINKFLVYGFLIVHIPILFVHPIVSGIKIPYSGIFYNPNSLGAVAVVVYIIAFARFSSIIDNFICYKKCCYKGSVFYGMVIFSSFILILYSNSRTCFGTVIIISIIYFTLLLKQVLARKKIIIDRFLKMTGFFMFFIVVCTIIIIKSSIGGLIESTIVSKTVEKSDDLLAGRGMIWSVVIDDASVFGHGRGYFSQAGVGPYSTYISVLGQYGILSVIMYCIFLLSLLYYSYKYAITNKWDNYRYLPIYMVLTYITMSVTEGMFLKPCMLITYLIIGVVSDKKVLDYKI